MTHGRHYTKRILLYTPGCCSRVEPDAVRRPHVMGWIYLLTCPGPWARLPSDWAWALCGRPTTPAIKRPSVLSLVYLFRLCSPHGGPLSARLEAASLNPTLRALLPHIGSESARPSSITRRLVAPGPRPHHCTRCSPLNARPIPTVLLSTPTSLPQTAQELPALEFLLTGRSAASLRVA